MSFRSLLRRVYPSRPDAQPREEKGPSCLVLLLREYHFFTQAELTRAAQSAWQRDFSGGEGSRHFVVQEKFATLIKAGPHALQVLHAPQPYLGELTEVDLRTFLPEPERREAWRSHRAWASVDYLAIARDTNTKYAVLAELVAEMVDENCTGIWVPEMSAFIPNNRDAYGYLQKLASFGNPEID
jgi:hypothetical protein